MDPNMITPSPPPSVYSSSSIESLRSAASSPAIAFVSKTIPPTPESVPKFPFGLQLKTFRYIQEELEGICFEMVQKHSDDILVSNHIHCKEKLELHTACKRLPKLDIDIDRESLDSWIPDIRHAAVHRAEVTAIAACKSIDEAAKLAVSLGYDQVGEEIKMIAKEMDWARCEMKKYEALTVADLSEEAKDAVQKCLTWDFAGIKDGTVWRREHWQWEISDDVTKYTFSQKIDENPWCDPSYWRQDQLNEEPPTLPETC